MVASRPFHVMVKPAGAACNLGCQYCYYLEKKALYPKTQLRMSPETLRNYIRQYIEAQPTDDVNFAWQGGEPTLLGVDFFREVVKLQQEFANGKTITNALQTNGTRLNDEWGAFLAEKGFLIGISIDGPQKLHDHFRVGRRGEPTFDRVIRGLEVLKKHKVEFNTLTVVNRENAKHPEDVYRFLKGLGSRHLQFIPLVERKPTEADLDAGLSLASPNLMHPDDDPTSPVTPWSVRPEQLGNFLIKIFDRWYAKDIGRIYLQLVEDVFAKIVQAPQGGLCSHSLVCGSGLAMEHNGDVYMCDHFVYPRFRLGNVNETPLASMVDSREQVAFGEAKYKTLTTTCRQCPWLAACGGDCPKHRFGLSPKGEKGQSYLCGAYAQFFAHAVPPLMKLAGRN